MSKFVKKREQSKKNLKKLKQRIDNLGRTDAPPESTPFILSFICKLFRLRN